ncbi:MAG: hypothetical protein SA339_05000 [Methanomassiliicoccus sp.]|nr:hypothetical protein [Methanomassiliicoccus sp.]
MALIESHGIPKIILSLDQWKCLRATGQVTVATISGPVTIKLGA